jgi:hypothetical protein
VRIDREKGVVVLRDNKEPFKEFEVPCNALASFVRSTAALDYFLSHVAVTRLSSRSCRPLTHFA